MIELGTLATVVMDSETGGPRVVDEEAKGAWRDIGPGYLDDIQVVSIWSFHVALYALQNPTPENVAQALRMIGMSGDCEDATDLDTLLPLPVDAPNGWDDPLYAAGDGGGA